MAFCLPKKEADTFLNALRKGEIDPDKLRDMTSMERRDYFDTLLGKGHGKEVNTLLEQKLLLKDFKRGLVTWAKQIAGLKPEAKRDLVTRIEKMENILSPASEKEFLNDLAEKRLGVGVSLDEAQKILELSNEVKANESKKGDEDFDTRMEYGRAVVELQDYVNDLKNTANKTTLQDFTRRPIQTLAKGLVKAPGFTKALQSSLDNSALLRQGYRTLWAHPGIWAKNATQTFIDIAKTIGGKAVEKEVQADILSRPNVELYRKSKLDVGTREEAFPTSIPEKIPGLGRLFKASENAYTGFLHRTRADVFDKYIEIAQKNDVELTNQELINIGRLVNALTGRGNLGKLERAAETTNVLFFSPRNVKAHVDTLTQWATGGATIGEIAEGTNKGSNFVRKQAAINLMKTITGTAGVLALANALMPGSVEKDPRSPDFGKIRVGKTRFDVTGGSGSLFVLASRLASGATKSSTSGNIKDLDGSKFGGQSRFDITVDFLNNKTAPMAREIIDMMKGQTFDGHKPFSLTDTNTYAPTAGRLITPLPVKNAIENWNAPGSAPFLLTTIADGLGVGTQTYKDRPKTKSQGKPQK